MTHGLVKTALILFPILAVALQRPAMAGACPCPDVNNDDDVNVLDLNALLANWGTDLAAADFNDDGIVDVQDLIALISAWGPCPPPAPPGACCLVGAEVACIQTCELDCNRMSSGRVIATYQGDFTSCASPVIDCPAGACCQVDDGSCSMQIEENCLSSGGVFIGPAVACTATTCAMGACCQPSGCEVMLAADCTGSSRSYLGDGSTCDDPCPAFGACCIYGGHYSAQFCVVLSQVECEEDPDYVWYGGGDFQGTGSACTDPGILCPIGACCVPVSFYPPEYVCTQQTNIGCNGGEGEVYFGGGTTCDDNLCATGACDLPDGSCVVTLEVFCLNPYFDGKFQGPNTLCP